MPLLPVLYTDNWKDAFGSQYAAENTVNFIAPPIVTLAGVSVRTAAINIAYPLETTIDWGDGTIQLNQAAGAKTHDYKADGLYVITVMNETYSDVQAQVEAWVNYGRASLNLDATATLLDATVAITGQVYPITLDWGDGTTKFLANDSELEANKTHTYEADGDFTVTILDSAVRRSSETITVAGTAALVMPQPAPAPDWTGFTRHADFDEYLAEEGIDQPEGWASMTIAEKKTWLDENV